MTSAVTSSTTSAAKKKDATPIINAVYEGRFILNTEPKDHYTILLNPDNKRITIPNGVVTSDVITNISGQGEIRVDMTFGIGYSDDIDNTKKVIQEVADKCPLILKSKPVDIFVSELADSSVNFAVRPWANSEHYWDVYFYMH